MLYSKIYCGYYLWLWLNRNIRSSNRLLRLTTTLSTSGKEIIIIGRLELLMIAQHAGHIHISRCCIEMGMMMMSGSGAATAAARVNRHIGDDERRWHLKRRRYGGGRRGRDRVAV